MSSSNYSTKALLNMRFSDVIYSFNISIPTEAAVRDKETKLRLKTDKAGEKKDTKNEEKPKPITVIELKKHQSDSDTR